MTRCCIALRCSPDRPFGVINTCTRAEKQRLANGGGERASLSFPVVGVGSGASRT